MPEFDAYAAMLANRVVTRHTGKSRGAYNVPGSSNIGFDEGANHDDLVRQAAQIVKMTPRQFQEYAWEYAKGG